MGVVYAARDARLGRRVALKFLPPQWSHDETAKERFMREAQAASATDHPNICTIHDIGTTDDGQLFIVMARYDGDTLKKRLEAGALGVDEAIDIAAQVAEGLAKAHAAGVIHRDIKPGNLMLTEDGVKILDFGLAKFADARFKLTVEGSTIGTIAYMSPEQVRGDEADLRSDIWALGAVLYEMIAGHPPFRGGYPEAIAHAITRETPEPLRSARPDTPEALEQLVFRALHKDPAVRFQSARDLARALRRLQGRTLPLDLRTTAIEVSEVFPAASRRTRRTARRITAAAALAAAIAAASLWFFSPQTRIAVAIGPVVNQTGYAELDPYRMALTEELIAQLADSRVLRVFPYDRLAQSVGRFRQAGNDVSSREALQVIAMHSGAQILVIPALVYENGAWRARADLRDPRTATTEDVAEAPPRISSLPKDTTYSLMPALAAEIDARVLVRAPLGRRILQLARRLLSSEPSATPRMRSADTAAAFVAGLEAYDEQEYSSALRSFTTALDQDGRNPLIWAWRSRVARIMRRDDEAAEAAEQALQYLSGATAQENRPFVEAIAAEAREDAAAAQSRLQELARRFDDDPRWLLELAALQDRQARTREGWATAVASYHRAIALDGTLVRPHLELCRLYNQLQEPANAKQHAQQALARYRELGVRGGEAQALFCLTNTLSGGSEDERKDARSHAEHALQIVQDLQSTDSLPRAHFSIGVAAAEQGRFLEAIAAWEQAVELARTAGDAVLQPLLLMDLGFAHERLGNAARATEYYRESAALYERLGDERRAAQLQANSAALRILHGEQPDEALRDVQNALVVHRKLGDAEFQVVCLLAIGAYYLYAGKYDDAEREINRALSLAKERNLDQWVSTATLDLAQVRLERGDYIAARTLLLDAASDGSSRAGARARALLGLVRTRLGDFSGAAADFVAASADLNAREDVGWPRPALDSAMGQLAYEEGRNADARRHFIDAASRQTDVFAEGATVLARAYLGLLDAQEGATVAGRRAVQASLAEATRMQRIVLEVTCRLLLARVYLLERNPADALVVLDAVAPDRRRELSPELRAHVHYWRARTLDARGDRAGAKAEFETARTLVMDLRGSLPEPEGSRFAARPEIRAITGR